MKTLFSLLAALAVVSVGTSAFACNKFPAPRKALHEPASSTQAAQNVKKASAKG